MAINFNSSSSLNSFFNTSLGISNSTSSGGINDLLTTGTLNEYSSIKSGTYKKLLTAYYAKESTGQDANKSETMNNQGISSGASSANNALSDLKKMNISEDDKDAIQEKVKSFVDSYNGVIEKLSESDTKAVLQKGVWMTKAVASYAGVLNRVGIEVGTDNKLTLNVDKFQTANIEQIENVFKGNMSVGSKISYKINQVENVATSSGTLNYTKTGEKVKYSSMTTFDEYL